MRGVILAGGRGTRLGDSTKVVNKHLIPVYNKPMIYYPIETLKAMGCTDILIITGGDCIGGFAELLGGDYTYRVQNEPNGIAGALAQAEGFVSGIFPAILGDNLFEKAPTMPTRPTLYLTQTEKPEAFGVWDPKTDLIVEKPKIPPSNFVVSGLYVFDDKVFDIIRTLKPSTRGELEVTDINNIYNRRGEINFARLDGFWSDMGTPETLLKCSGYVAERVGQ